MKNDLGESRGTVGIRQGNRRGKNESFNKFNKGTSEKGTTNMDKLVFQTFLAKQVRRKKDSARQEVGKD